MGAFSLGSKGKEADKNEKADAVPFLDLFRFSSRCDRVLIGLGVLCAVIEGAMLPGLMFLMGRVANIYIQTENTVLNDEFMRQVAVNAGIYLAAGIVLFAVSTAEHFLFSLAASRTVATIRKEFMHSVIAQDAIFLDASSTGALSNQLNNNVDRIRDGIGDKIGMITRSVAIFLSSIIGSFIMEWRITLIMIALGPICALNNALMPIFSGKSMKETLQIAEDANGLADECISNVKTVVACNGQATMIKKYAAILKSGFAPALRVGFIYGFFEGFFFFFLYLLFCSGLWYGIDGYHQGFIAEVGNVFAVANAILYSAYILGILSPHMLAILKARASAAIVYATIDRIPSVDLRTEQGLNPPVDCSIDFEGVHFAYPTRRDTPVLNGLNWRAAAGETIALVGKSGCGKSTSIGLLTRLFNSTGGSIKLGGAPLEHYNIPKLRKIIGIVSQEPNLFTGTIRENIRLGREDIWESAIEDAARVANAHEFIVGLEKGYETLLGPSGVALSGGQKQRIAIARAIASNPRILLLDEATSALDTHSERVVQAALNKASSGRTTLVVAHRLSTIKDVDRIYVLDGGRVVEEGTYADLASRENGIFARMVAMQEVEKKPESDDDESPSPPPRRRTTSKPLSIEDDEPILQPFMQFQRRSSTLCSIRDSTRRPIVPEIKEEPAYPTVHGGLLALLSMDKLRVACQIVSSCIRGCELIIFTIIWYYLFEASTLEDYTHLLTVSLSAEMSLGVATWAAILLSRSTAAWVNERVLFGVRVKAFSSLLHRPIAYFDRSSSSTAACSVMLSQQAMLAAPGLDYRASLMYENVFATVGVVVVCFIYCWQNGFICLFCATMFAVLFFGLTRFEQHFNGAYEKADETGEATVEIFDNVRSIQLLSVEKYFLDGFVDNQKESAQPLNKRAIFRALIHGLSQSFCFINVFIATTVGMFLLYGGIITNNQQFISEVCIANVGWAVMVMAMSLNDLSGSASAARSLLSLVDPAEHSIDKGAKPNIKGLVVARGVDFAYPSRPNHRVTKGLDFVLAPGKSLALVGPSGSGKSTIVSLLERFYEPTRGTIKLDETDLGSVSLSHLRSSVALVGQEPVLFRGTIYENITLGCQNAMIDDVRSACKLANAAEFIEALPQGYDTLISGRSSLSGGQKQRIAIARALVRRPKIILLDEATSALDPASEKVVKLALEATARERTSISIAHRLDTIRNCDEILFVEDGVVVERGCHSTLMQIRDGKYAALVAQQSLG